MLYLWSGRGRECNHRPNTYLIDDGAYATVLRAKVMSPFGDAVRLIYGIKRDIDTLEKFDIFLFGKRFGRHVQQPSATGDNVVLNFLYSRATQRRIEKMSYGVIAAVLTHSIHLIFHQCYQWRNNHGSTGTYQSRKLVA